MAPNASTLAIPLGAPSARSAAIARWFTPSLSDVLFVALFLWLFVVGAGGGWNGLLADGDVGWHIRTGDYILDTGAVPRHDLFSFTKPGAPWFAWEWGSDVLFAEAHRIAGLKGVVLIAGVLIALWPVLLLRQALWRGANPWAALVVSLLGFGAGSMHFLARPHLFTLLFTTAAAWTIESERRTPSWRAWLLVPFTVLWVNLHGGFVVLIALLGLAAAGSAVETLVNRSSWRTPVRFGVLTGACSLASLLNPYGWQLHAHVLAYLRSDWIRSTVQEFQAPDFRSENQSQFEILLFAGLMTAALLISRRRYVEALWLAVFAHLSLTSIRHAPVDVSIAAPIVAAVITELWKQRPGVLYAVGADLAPAFRRTSICLVPFVAVIALSGGTKWPDDFPAECFPTALIGRHAGLLANSRVLTVDQWADYLIYRNYPQQRVFADGRSDFYGPELGGEYLRATQADYRWPQTLAKFQVTTVLAPVSWPLSTVLKSDPRWRIVADDGRAILFTASNTARVRSLTTGN